MKYLCLVLCSMCRRNRLRNALIIAVATTTILLAIFLMTVDFSLRGGTDTSGANVVLTINHFRPAGMPMAYAEAIRKVPGVVRVSHTTFSSMFYKDSKNAIPTLAVESATLFQNNSGVKVPADQMDAYLKDANGALVGNVLASRLGLKIGDSLNLRGVTWPIDLELVVRGIFDASEDAQVQTGLAVFHRETLTRQLAAIGDEYQGRVTTFSVLLEDSSRLGSISTQIDALFKGGADRTRTMPMNAYLASNLNRLGNFRRLLLIVGAASIVAMIMVSVSSLMLAARERSAEIGVLKSIGFGRGTIVALILTESVLLTLTGATLAAVAAVLLAHGMTAELATLLRASVRVPLTAHLLGFGIALVMGVLGGALPAWIASSRPATETLRSIR